MILSSTLRNIGNKRNYKVLFWRHCWTMLKLEWNRTLVRIHTSLQLKHDYLSSFDKTWGGHFLLYGRDYFMLSGHTHLPKMGKFLECPIGMWFLSPWLCVYRPLGCFLFFFSLQSSSFQLCPKTNQKQKPFVTSSYACIS